MFLLQVAFIIPFRNRPQQLSIFLRHMHPLLKKQKLDYRIFVVEQVNIHVTWTDKERTRQKTLPVWEVTFQSSLGIVK